MNLAHSRPRTPNPTSAASRSFLRTHLPLPPLPDKERTRPSLRLWVWLSGEVVSSLGVHRVHMSAGLFRALFSDYKIFISFSHIFSFFISKKKCGFVAGGVHVSAFIKQGTSRSLWSILRLFCRGGGGGGGGGGGCGGGGGGGVYYKQ